VLISYQHTNLIKLLRIAKKVHITFITSRTSEWVWRERMKLVVGKSGFAWEEAEREFIEWQFQRLNLFQYGILWGG